MMLGSLPTGGLTLRMIADELAEQEFVVLPIRLEDTLQFERLPALHRDPFDRVLISQAIEEGVPLLTIDAATEQYPITTIW
jgi:PIN domain nuclease of toxin-antitoxin system